MFQCDLQDLEHKCYSGEQSLFRIHPSFVVCDFCPKQTTKEISDLMQGRKGDDYF